MIRICCAAAAMSLLVWSATVNSADEIRRNPFTRPPPNVVATQEVAAPMRITEEWRAELRAVLVAGRKSSADLGGLILGLGESAHGYRLLSVGEGTATFSREGEKVVLSLYERQISEER